jgi:protein-tyrosine-phosphatase
MRIHFICRGNILRSIIAETYLKSLNLEDVDTLSSGTNVNWEDVSEKEHFSNSMKLLDRHSIRQFAKPVPEQLTQQRIKAGDIVVCMNQRVVDEANAIVELPLNILNWDITDIGEANRTVAESRGQYEEEIYKEITDKVDELVEEASLQAKKLN